MLATATCTTKLKVSILDFLQLSMIPMETVAVVPDRQNIFLELRTKPGMDYMEELQEYLEELQEKKREAGKAIIYCK